MSCSEAHNMAIRNACIEADAHGDDVYVNANGILMCQDCHLVVYWQDEETSSSRSSKTTHWEDDDV